MRTDKYAKASALSKILEDLVSRNGGDKEKAVLEMDAKLGPAWRAEIVIPDEIGPEFVDPMLLVGPHCDVEPNQDELDDMFRRAREVSKDDIRPGDDLEFNFRRDKYPKEESGDTKELSKLLREFADKLDKLGQ